ncbi:tyrosine-type recombinase/integrase [Roseivivax marinus]|uniref:tyrosine-type recombinase/integrase n=1 Tax=Roseivivax marinus TaxID=1379903 RepID=UPI00273DE708|nr:tyrosine-type recombinase/integrase [Roseivivax marinus]
MLERQDTDYTVSERALICRDIVLEHMTQMAADSVSPDVDFDARIDEREAECQEIRNRIRAKDFAVAEELVRMSCARLMIPVRPNTSPEFARLVCTTRRQLLKLEIDALEECEDPLVKGWDLLQRHNIPVVKGQLPHFLSLSEALEIALDGQTEEMTRKLKTTVSLVIAYAGDIPVDRLEDVIRDFMIWMSRLPKLHGKRHGNNRHTKDNDLPKKQAEIDKADLEDAALYARFAARTDISVAQKRAELAQQLTTRVTHTNLERHLDRLHQLLRLIESRAGYTGRTKLLSYSELSRTIKADCENRLAQNPLFIRITQPKIRLRWAGSRIRTLLTSTIYRGCTLPNRMTKGRNIYRNARYWVPLILMTMGCRPSEVLRLTRGDLIWRDDVFCLQLCWSAEQDGKTVDSQRIVPIPQVLIDLGFIQWIRDFAEPRDLLFPEIMEANSENPQNIFSKRMLTVRKNLGIASYNEDLYALRKSLSSALWDGGVDIETRQMIIGHVSDTTIGRHYTSANMKHLKELLDRAKHGLVIKYSKVHKFPVIVDCTLVSGTPARPDIMLDSSGHVGALRLVDEETGKPIVAVILKNAVMPAQPAWRDARVLSASVAAEAVADTIGRYLIMLPENDDLRMALEHFLAMAACTSDYKPSRDDEDDELADAAEIAA